MNEQLFELLEQLRKEYDEKSATVARLQDLDDTSWREYGSQKCKRLLAQEDEILAIRSMICDMIISNTEEGER